MKVAAAQLFMTPAAGFRDTKRECGPGAKPRLF
jgi:hypothetical protein